jgi:putative endonuclease
MKALYQIADLLRHAGLRRQLTHSEALGHRAEDVAHRYLERRGFTVVARNYRASNGSGDLDIVAWDGDVLVFVEVKSRSSDELASPLRALSREKEEHLIRLSYDYRRRARLENSLVRFDVISVVFSSPNRVEHIRDAFAPPRKFGNRPDTREFAD